MKKIILYAGLAVLVGLAAWKLASNKKKIDAKSQPALNDNFQIPVNVATVAYADQSQPLVQTGTLIPYKEADIAALSSGKLISLNFQLGSFVTQGATVGAIDNKLNQLNLQQAQNNKDKALKDYNRYKALLQGDAATEVNVQDAKLQYQNASNQIAIYEKQIADSRIKSPISGQIVSKEKEVGEFITAGTPIAHVVDVSRLKVDVMINEADVYNIKAGSPVTITSDIFPNEKFYGKVTFISSKGDATHNYQVEITIDNHNSARLKAGTFVYADFTVHSNVRYLTIPRGALAQGLKTPNVYVVQDGKAVLKQIVVGREAGDQVFLVSGLNVGDQVIVNGQINIQNGTAVKINNQGK